MGVGGAHWAVVYSIVGQGRARPPASAQLRMPDPQMLTLKLRYL